MFLRLQAYKQKSLKHHQVKKLSPKYYGPFQILQRVGEVLYDWIYTQILSSTLLSMFLAWRLSWGNMWSLFQHYHLLIWMELSHQHQQLCYKKELISFIAKLSLKSYSNGRGKVLKMLLGRVCILCSKDSLTLWTRSSKGKGIVRITHWHTWLHIDIHW